MDQYAIILAAGKGQRMGATIPKQFIKLYKKPLWYYSVKVFLETFPHCHIIIATLPDSIRKIEKDIRKFFPNLNTAQIQVIRGGEMRFHSVKNALQYIPTHKKSIVFIHDAARCLIQANLLKKLYTATQQHQSAIPTVSVTDSILSKENYMYQYLDRSKIYSIQTPQVFQSDLLFHSFNTDFKPHFTDDASVVQYAGYPVHFVAGEVYNIKVTYPVDIVIAKWYLKNKVQ